MKYKCMSCGKVYYDKSLPTIDKGDGCCCIGSLIEIKETMSIIGDYYEEQVSALCRVIELEEKYISLLGSEIDKHAAYLHIHNIHTPENIVNAGLELREQIKEAKDKYMNIINEDYRT